MLWVHSFFLRGGVWPRSILTPSAWLCYHSPAAVMQDHAAAVARQARANQALSTRELVQQRKAKASAAAAWAALKAGDDADVEPALAPGSEPTKAKAKAKKAKKKAGKGKKAKKSGAKLQAEAGAGEGGSDAKDAGAGGGSDPARATKKKTKGKKRPRDAAAILQQLNRGPTKRKADSAKVGRRCAGGVAVMVRQHIFDTVTLHTRRPTGA